MSCDEVVPIAKKALRILGDSEHSHLWDCQVDGHALIALDIAELLRKAKTDKDLQKVLKKINKNDFNCESDSHSEIMSEISELIARALAEEKKESGL